MLRCLGEDCKSLTLLQAQDNSLNWMDMYRFVAFYMHFVPDMFKLRSLRNKRKSRMDSFNLQHKLLKRPIHLHLVAGVAARHTVVCGVADVAIQPIHPASLCLPTICAGQKHQAHELRERQRKLAANFLVVLLICTPSNHLRAHSLSVAYGISAHLLTHSWVQASLRRISLNVGRFCGFPWRVVTL